jgi:putative DNA primase/helicase
MAVPLLGRAVQRTMRAIQARRSWSARAGWKARAGGSGRPTARSTEAMMKLFRKAGSTSSPKCGGKVKLYSATTIAAWGRTSESAGHIGCIPKLAEARLAARTEDFDADPLQLNVLNGTIVFRRPEAASPPRSRCASIAART